MMPASPPLGFFFWRVRTVLLAVARCSFSMASRLDRIFRSCSQRGGKLRSKLTGRLRGKLRNEQQAEGRVLKSRSIFPKYASTAHLNVWGIERDLRILAGQTVLEGVPQRECLVLQAEKLKRPWLGNKCKKNDSQHYSERHYAAGH